MLVCTDYRGYECRTVRLYVVYVDGDNMQCNEVYVNRTDLRKAVVQFALQDVLQCTCSVCSDAAA